MEAGLRTVLLHCGSGQRAIIPGNCQRRILQSRSALMHIEGIPKHGVERLRELRVLRVAASLEHGPAVAASCRPVAFTTAITVTRRWPGDVVSSPPVSPGRNPASSSRVSSCPDSLRGRSPSCAPTRPRCPCRAFPGPRRRPVDVDRHPQCRDPARVPGVAAELQRASRGSPHREGRRDEGAHGAADDPCPADAEVVEYLCDVLAVALIPYRPDGALLGPRPRRSGATMRRSGADVGSRGRKPGSGADVGSRGQEPMSGAEARSRGQEPRPGTEVRSRGQELGPSRVGRGDPADGDHRVGVVPPPHGDLELSAGDGDALGATQDEPAEGVEMAAGLPGAGLPGAELPGAGLPAAGLPGAGLPGAGLRVIARSIRRPSCTRLR